MNKTILTITLLAFSVIAFGQNKIMLDATKAETTISKHIYGHFAEHLGRCIYDGFYVGDSSSIPNTAGVRNDIVEALKNLNIPNLRWPGGCFADTYHWKDGIGPKEERPTIVNRWWGGVTEDNSFGTHDFLNMCELLGTEPYLSGNVGSGTVQEFADWMQYVNHDGISPMADLRRENGREKPWNVKYWGVGNEAWGCGGNMTAEYYANVYRQFATYMSGWTNDGRVERIASGASSNDYEWTETLMKNIPGKLIDGIALHHYSVIDWSNKGSATDFSDEQYFTTMQRAYAMDELITNHVKIMDKYDPDNRIDLVVDEWGGWYDVEEGTNPGFLFQQNTIRDAMLAGMTLNIFNNHAERVKMANLAQTVNVLQAVVLTEGSKMILTPTYHVMEMYKVHHDARLVPFEFSSPDYMLEDKKLPAVSISGSIDASNRMHLSLTNIDHENSHEIEIEVNGFNAKNVSGRILTAESLQAHNTFDNPDKVKPEVFKKAKLSKGSLKLEIPAHSVVVLELTQ